MSVDFDTARWRKSTHSGQGGADCVEVADLATVITESDSSFADET
jgi:hypothetical protein